MIILKLFGKYLTFFLGCNLMRTGLRDMGTWGQVWGGGRKLWEPPRCRASISILTLIALYYHNLCIGGLFPIRLLVPQDWVLNCPTQVPLALAFPMTLRRMQYLHTEILHGQWMKVNRRTGGRNLGSIYTEKYSKSWWITVKEKFQWVAEGLKEGQSIVMEAEREWGRKGNQKGSQDKACHRSRGMEPWITLNPEMNSKVWPSL